MLRSFLSRPQPLLSHLRRHPHHHDYCRSVAQLGRCADWIPSRGYTSSEDDTDADVQGSAAAPSGYGYRRQQHLYVVLNDWQMGFSVHKLDLYDGADNVDLAWRAPVHRMSTDSPDLWSFAALGSKIVSMGPIKYVGDHIPFAYDTETAGLSVVPGSPPAPCGWRHAAAVGNMLYMFGTDSDGRVGCTNEGMYSLKDARSSASRFDAHWYWSWDGIATPLPFRVADMESIATHPERGGRHLFVCVGTCEMSVPTDDDDDGGRFIHTSQTFSYDTQTSEWRHLGEWNLPFYGQAHYDGELGAWIGLHKGETSDRFDSARADGLLCSCDAPSPYESPTQPAWKLCEKDRLFDPNRNEHGPSLVYMGDSTYSLVEVMSRESLWSKRHRSVGNRSAIRVATFRLKYDKNGDLVTTARRPDRFYHFSRFVEGYKVHAFWM